MGVDVKRVAGKMVKEGESGRREGRKDDEKGGVEGGKGGKRGKENREGRRKQNRENEEDRNKIKKGKG